MKRIVNISILVIALGACSVSLSDVGKMCLFSGISGVITLNGEPAVGAKVRRIVDKAHTHGKKNDETIVDDNGYFKMPPIYDRSIIGKILPMQFAVGQEIYVDFQGLTYEVWSGVKQKREENSESNGKPLIVECRLEGERERIAVGGGVIYSRCVWDVEPDEEIDYENLPGPGLG